MRQIFEYFLVLLGMTYPLLGNAQTISFETKVKVRKPTDATFSELKEGDSLQLGKGENALILTNEGLPLLIYLPKDEASNLRVTEANLKDALKEHLQTSLNASTNEVLEGVRKTESQIQKRNLSQALYTITELKNKYPQISGVLFMSATVQYLNKNNVAAVEDLTKGLAIDPGNIPAQKLLAELKGGAK